MSLLTEAQAVMEKAGMEIERLRAQNGKLIDALYGMVGSAELFEARADGFAPSRTALQSCIARARALLKETDHAR